MSKKTKRPPAAAKRGRTERRANDREAEKLRAQVEKLYALENGGSPDRPATLSSPSQVEVDAESRACPLCQGRLRLDGPHEVEEHAAERLRVARLTCLDCRARWNRWYRLGAVLN